MSGLETLPPDQRAVLQLILVQGRGYADLAGLLQLDVSAVRDRARAGVDALGVPGGDTLDPDSRARIADYLLGQQDDGERIVTFAELGESAAACHWAQGLRQRLAGLAKADLPAVPAAASSNGSTATTTPPSPPPVATAAATPAAPVSAPALATGTSVASAPAVSTPAPPTGGAPASAGAPRPSSRLGGAVLLAGVAALVIVLAIVLIGGGDDGEPSASTTAPTQPAARTQPTTTQTTPQAQARVIGQANLLPSAAGGQALGVGLVQRSGRQRVLAIQAARLPANGAQDIYAVWLQDPSGTKFLGFVPRQVRNQGRFTVSAPLPASAATGATVLVTREGVTAVPTTPGETILSGQLRLTA